MKDIVQQALNALFSKTSMMLFMVIFLLGTWIALIVAKKMYPDLEVTALITTIQLALGGLGINHLKEMIAGMKGGGDDGSDAGSDTAQAAPTNTQSGRSMLGMLVLMASLSCVFFSAASLTGCSQFGLQSAQSFDDKLAYSYGTVASVRAATATALTAGSIKVADAEEVQSLADQARALLDSARLLEKTDVTTANGKLLLASSILVQLQSYTASRGIK